MTYQQQISLSTNGHGDMHDLTEKVAAIVNSSGIKTGLMHVFNVGKTAALGTIGFDLGLQLRFDVQIWTSSFRPAVITAIQCRSQNHAVAARSQRPRTKQ